MKDRWDNGWWRDSRRDNRSNEAKVILLDWGNLAAETYLCSTAHRHSLDLYWWIALGARQWHQILWATKGLMRQKLQKLDYIILEIQGQLQRNIQRHPCLLVQIFCFKLVLQAPWWVTTPNTGGLWDLFRCAGVCGFKGNRVISY